jgi:hypothetical protein
MAIGDGYNPSTITNQAAQAAVDKLKADSEFRARYFSDDTYTRNFAIDQMSIAQQNLASIPRKAKSEKVSTVKEIGWFSPSCRIDGMSTAQLSFFGDLWRGMTENRGFDGDCHTHTFTNAVGPSAGTPRARLSA